MPKMGKEKDKNMTMDFVKTCLSTVDESNAPMHRLGSHHLSILGNHLFTAVDIGRGPSASELDISTASDTFSIRDFNDRPTG